MKSRSSWTPLAEDRLPTPLRGCFPDDLDEIPAHFDDDPWEAFLPDDQVEPLPEPGDFWIESDPTDALLLVA
jgi:hypothetical protein